MWILVQFKPIRRQLLFALIPMLYAILRTGWADWVLLADLVWAKFAFGLGIASNTDYEGVNSTRPIPSWVQLHAMPQAYAEANTVVQFLVLAACTSLAVALGILVWAAIRSWTLSTGQYLDEIFARAMAAQRAIENAEQNLSRLRSTAQSFQLNAGEFAKLSVEAGSKIELQIDRLSEIADKFDQVAKNAESPAIGSAEGPLQTESNQSPGPSNRFDASAFET